MTEPRRTLLDRALTAYPLVATYILLLVLYAWQTTRIPSPWIFTDELKWSLLSRSIAHTGRPEIREHAAGFTSLYSYFLAPAWWLGSTGPGYAAAKYLNAAAMTATIFPAYGLARLFLPRLASYLAAVASVAIPSLAVTGILMPESLAYFWSALALYAVAGAILRPTWLRGACAVAACLLAPAMRSQLQVVIPAALIAAAVFAVTSAPARSVMRRWTWTDRAGAAILFLGATIALDVLLLHHSYEWYIGTHFWHRALTYGLWALGAFTIGVGVLPVLLALAWAVQGVPGTREDRALLGLVAGTVLSFGAYTAVKASFLSTNFAIRIEERNLIYLSPIAFIAAGRWLLQARFRPVPVAVSGVAVGYLLWTTPYHAYEHLYSDAFGLSILQWLNQKWYWTNTDLKRLLIAILVVGALCTVAMRWRQRAARPIAIATLVLSLATIGWNLTGEIAAANASISPGKAQRAVLPTPPNWVDYATGRARTMFIGKALANSNWLWSFEFWNQSIQDVWSVDASVPPPGPGVTPNFLHTDGTLDPQLPVDYAITQPEIVMVGKIKESEGGVNLYTVPRPIRMSSFVSGITADGWMQDYSRFVRFAPRPVSGTITVSISRGAACGKVPDAQFVFRVSSLRIDGDGQPVAARRERVVRTTVAPCVADRVVRIPARAPFRVDATATGLFRAGDGRELSAFVSYSFAPR